MYEMNISWLGEQSSDYKYLLDIIAQLVFLQFSVIYELNNFQAFCKGMLK